MARRQSLFAAGLGGGGGGSVASGTMVGVTKQSLMLVSKADFTEHYPQLLLEVTVEDADIFDDEEEAIAEDDLPEWLTDGIDEDTGVISEDIFDEAEPDAEDMS